MRSGAPGDITEHVQSLMHMLSHFSHVRLFGSMDRTCQAFVSMGFSWQEHWSGCHVLPH